MKGIVFALALTSSAFAMADGAVHISNFGCGMLNGQGAFVITTDSRVTETPPQAGVTILKCSAKNVANNTGKAVRWDHATTHYLCNTPKGSTTDWSEEVSASGQATLTCKLHQ